MIMASRKQCGAAVAVLASAMLNIATATAALVARQDSSDPFAPIDPQHWVVCLEQANTSLKLN